MRTARFGVDLIAVLALLLGCREPFEEIHSDGDGDGDADADGDGDVDGDGDGDGDVDQFPPGWIGSSCESDNECDYSYGVCLTELPGGYCTQACDLFCPDRDGYPVTFCVDEGALPPEAGSWVDGACAARCDYGLFPQTGCRPGYGCTLAERANEPETERAVCLPGESEPLSTCQEELAALGVSFEPTSVAPESPSSHPSLTCVIDDPVILHPPIHGVELVTSAGEPTPNMLAACEMALALVDTVDDVAQYGVTRIRHMGTYNCRVISGTDTLSRHSYGDAIDLYGFDFDDGALYTLVDDWEHDTSAPVSEGGAWLYEAAYRWFDLEIWNIILTPNYNADHDDHFHVDLTPGSHFIEGIFPISPPYIGPAPFAD